MAIVSSYRNRAIDDKVIAFGEVGLSGEVRAVSMAEARVREACKLGFSTCIVPYSCLESVSGIKGIKTLGVKTIGEALELF